MSTDDFGQFELRANDNDVDEGGEEEDDGAGCEEAAADGWRSFHGCWLCSSVYCSTYRAGRNKKMKPFGRAATWRVKIATE